VSWKSVLDLFYFITNHYDQVDSLILQRWWLSAFFSVYGVSGATVASTIPLVRREVGTTPE
jgi:hypothetical protein